MGKKARKERKQRRERKKQEGNNIQKVMSVLGGSFLGRKNFVKQFPFIVMVTVLLMVLITNTYIAESRTREIADRTRTINDLHVTYIQLKSEIMQASKQSVLTKKLGKTGLKAPMDPLKRINVVDNPEDKEEKK